MKFISEKFVVLYADLPKLLGYILVVCIVLLLSWYFDYIRRRRRLYELADKIPGPSGLPFIGSLHSFSKLKPSGEYTRFNYTLLKI